MIELDYFKNIPFESVALQDTIGNYKFPRNKISSLEKHGQIIRLKKGLYVLPEKISRVAISRELIANHLYGPSYISLETALSFYGIIPEKVFAVRSMTTRRSNTFETPVGNYDYTTVPVDYFSIGLRHEIVDNQYAFLIASPAKALCDMLISTSNLRLQSIKAIRHYLLEDLRVDSSALKDFDSAIVRQCVETGRKKSELNLLLELLKIL